MASNNQPPIFKTFSITQSFLGAPLQFQPALGSQELDELIDSYVIGPASKLDKFSEVTIDFYKHATVDINTGVLFRTYDVFPSPWATYAFEQSPVQSQFSGFSPPIFTPSPGSSAALGDSGYGSFSSFSSFSRTPPNRYRSGRVSKKAKKETSKTAEARLPGFSIMTKDGVDVTSTAGRGTKTKEQREHAHLMRVIKVCDACKRKKVRCDPSHRVGHNDMCDPSHRLGHNDVARTSTSTKTPSPRNFDPSPAVSVPSLSRESTSQGSTASFPCRDLIDDFVLFPESDWNLADVSIPECESQDFGFSPFDFEVYSDPIYDPYLSGLQASAFAAYNQPYSSAQDHQFGCIPSTRDPNDLDQVAYPNSWMCPPHSILNPSASLHDKGLPDRRSTSDPLPVECPTSSLQPRDLREDYSPAYYEYFGPQPSQQSSSNLSPSSSLDPIATRVDTPSVPLALIKPVKQPETHPQGCASIRVASTSDSYSGIPDLCVGWYYFTSATESASSVRLINQRMLPFTRKDHFRDHLRDYHEEDLNIIHNRVDSFSGVVQCVGYGVAVSPIKRKPSPKEPVDMADLIAPAIAAYLLTLLACLCLSWMRCIQNCTQTSGSIVLAACAALTLLSSRTSFSKDLAGPKGSWWSDIMSESSWIRGFLNLREGRVEIE